MIALLATIAMAGPFAEIDSARIEADVRALSDGSIAQSRNIHHPGNAAAEAWIADQFRAIDGLEVTEEVFMADGVPGVANVVADLPGSDSTKPWILITAHLDSTGSGEDGYDPATDPAPGADDDASGIAAILEIARVLSPHEYGSTIRFIAFNAEEEGLLGAFHHAEALDGQAVQVVFNMDPVGFNPGGGDVLWATYDARWPDEAAALEALAPTVSETLTVTIIDAELLGGDRRSDHAPFWDEGYAALHLASFPQPAEYHTANDTIDLVDPEFTAAVAGLVAERTAALAGEVVQVEEDKGCGCTTGGPALFGWWVAVGLVVRRRKNFLGPCHNRR